MLKKSFSCSFLCLFCRKHLLWHRIVWETSLNFIGRDIKVFIVVVGCPILVTLCMPCAKHSSNRSRLLHFLRQVEESCIVARATTTKITLPYLVKENADIGRQSRWRRDRERRIGIRRNQELRGYGTKKKTGGWEKTWILIIQSSDVVKKYVHYPKAKILR